MTTSNLRREVRTRLYDALRRELMGPSSLDETIPEFPTARYLVGRIAPAKSDQDDTDALIDPAENDTLAAGPSDSEAGEEEASPPLIIGFNPSSFGISFLIDLSEPVLRAVVTWGDYKRDGSAATGNMWRRTQREAVIDGIRVDRSGSLPRILMSNTAGNPPEVSVTGVDDPEIALEGVVRDFAGYRAVSLFVVNRRTKGRQGDRTKDERWIYQPQLKVTGPGERPVFVAKAGQYGVVDQTDDVEIATSSLMYRHAREFASGHGVAAGWTVPPAGKRATEVFTQFIPQYEVPLLVAPSDITGGAVLDMKSLGACPSKASLVNLLAPMVSAYEAWVGKLRVAAAAADIQSDPSLREAASANIERCVECVERMRAGLDLVGRDDAVFDAFRFANKAMWDQRVHSLSASANRKGGTISSSASDYDSPKNRTWRPFQMGFILLNLVGIAEENSADRRLIDLLWFPTGGGKTEAYLGLAAFTIGLRRRKGARHGLAADAGVSIIMRYTLRLLTVQQFQRAAALICACEVLRRNDVATWGEEPFLIGVWVGRGTTPNTFADSQKALEDIQQGKKPIGGSPVQLVSCPRCGQILASDIGVPLRNTYQLDTTRQRTLIWCCNDRCAFSAGSSRGCGLPVVVVDDEIYRSCPSLLVATVDKFARIPFKGETRAIFGLRNRFSLTYGHLSEAHGDNVGGRKIRDGIAAVPLLPPELIIQDELHLISGPLGTMVGLYETIVQFGSSVVLQSGARIGPKIIASTATIRRAAEQTHQLYGGRSLAIFPPPGVSARDSFFAKEIPVNPADDESSGRLYLGLNAPGSSTKTLLVRVYATLLAAAENEIKSDAATSDPYGTLVGYFNSMRALGGAKRLVEDDVSLVRLRYLAQQRGFARRTIASVEELTSRIDSWRIPALLKRLDSVFPRGGSDWPVDVLLATNMISVGVDIDRLGLMVVAGQPKTTAEYIQATSRVGRKFPGLVVVMYNWMGARDLSHYERFESYHAALYRFVEAISVTPFSSRALDRGLRAVFAAMNRLFGDAMAGEPDAANFDALSDQTTSIIEEIFMRAAMLVGKSDAALVRKRLLSYRDDWAHLADDLLRYSWLNESQRPPNNTRVLLRTAGTHNDGEWSTPGSLREVEPTAAFYIDDRDS